MTMVNTRAAAEFLLNDPVRLRDQQRDVPSDTVGRILGRFPHPAGPTYAVSFVDEKLSVLELYADQIVLVEDSPLSVRRCRRGSSAPRSR